MGEGATFGPPPRRPPKALEAAKWLYDTQKAELIEDPTRPRASITSTRNAADKFGVSKSSVARHLVALKSGKTDGSSTARVGRPSRLTDSEEQMLAFHMFMLRRQMKPVTMKIVQDAADALMARRNPPGEAVSMSWVRRWLRTNRTQAREEAIANGSTMPGVDLANPDMDQEDDDTMLGEDAPSEVESETHAPQPPEPSAHDNIPTNGASAPPILDPVFTQAAFSET
ncbi:hypothetical protein GGS20DRAFT_202399 [Poronia punctata]|nr:hypothetical protein GGS20DRAFT_202399 [Poronia punctata]